MKPFWAALGVVALASVGLAGCAHATPVPVAGGVAAVQQYQIVVVNSEIQDDLFVNRTDVSYTPDGRLNVGIAVQNVSKGELHIRLRTTFRDAAGAPSEAPSPWVNIIIPRGANQPYGATALNNKARNFNIEIGRSQD